jgi:hypothetical protein
MKASPNSINSIALLAFEKELAEKLGLSREKESQMPQM